MDVFELFNDLLFLFFSWAYEVLFKFNKQVFAQYKG